MSTANSAETSSNNTYSFQTEIKQLLNLMIHSLYSQKEIFLRELISNASDAIDKRRFAALTDAALLPDEEEMRIRIQADKEAGTLTISDTGIGMSEQEVIDNIGTIARSGTKKFIEAIQDSDGDDAQTNLIGQFGVGFYSVFMVAGSVVLETRRAGEETATRWTSDGQGEFTIETIDQDDIGTSIVLTLKEDEKEYLEAFRVDHVIKKYSDHISLPIETLDEEGEWQTANTGTALWARTKNEIEEEEYNNFYQSLSFDSEAPLATLHHKVEGNLEYTSLLFLPKKAPFDLYQRDHRHGLKLYVRRIFIMDDAEQLLPTYLRFVRGVVDSADLPLNVSREILQNNKDIDKIKARLVKRVLDELTRMSKDDQEQYQAFWAEFGQVIKEGMVEDFANKDTLIELLRFASTNTDSTEQSVSLQEYVSRIPDDQEAIYYITAETFAAAQGSPHLEVFRKKGIEVLLLTDPVDEWLVGSLSEYQEKPLKSVSRGDLALDQDEEQSKQQEEDFAQVIESLQQQLESEVKSVRLTNRLTESPACLVADENDPGANMERIMKAMGQNMPGAKPILEINPDHAIVKALDADSEQFADWAKVLFEQAALSEGAPLQDPADYVKRINKLLSNALQ